MVGGCHDFRLQRLLFDQLAKFTIRLRSGESFSGGRQVVIIHVAERSDSLSAHAIKVVPSPAGDTDHAYAKLVRISFAESSACTGRNDSSPGGHRAHYERS